MGCQNLIAADEQPHTVETYTADGLYIMDIQIPKAESLVPQHAHAYDHTTLIVTGKVRIWLGEDIIGEKTAPDHIFIPAGTKHTFQTLVDDVRLCCIHNISRSGKVEITEEHQIVGKTCPSE